MPFAISTTWFTCSLYYNWYSNSGGGPLDKPLSALCEVVQRVLGEDNAVISGVEGSQDPAAMKLQILSQRCGPNYFWLTQNHDTPALDVLSSTSSQICPVVNYSPAVDDSTAEVPLPDDLQTLRREKLKILIKVLILQQEY